MELSTKTYLLHWVKRNLKKARRGIYRCRKFIPGLKERHYLESLIGPLGFWDKLQAYQFHVLKMHGLSPNHTLLDIGCGPLQGGIAFIRYLNRGQYVGIDKKGTVVAAAYRQIITCNLWNKNPVIIQSDTFGKNELRSRKFDYIWASQVLYHFDQVKIDRLMQCIKERLNRGGLFLGDILGPRHYEHVFPEHGYFLHSIDSIQQLARKHHLKVACFGEISNYGYPKSISLSTNLLLGIQNHR